MSTNKPIARKNDIVVQEFEGELLIYDLNLNKAFALNTTTASVWHNCNGKNTVAEIASRLTVEFNEFVSEDIIWLALDKLKNENLILNDANFVIPFENLSRREIIRQVGLTTMIALPVIATVVAPNAVHAASCTDPNNNLALNFVGCGCQSNNDCTNDCCGFMTICATIMSVANGSPCRVNCECVSNMCSGSPQTCMA